MSAAAGGGEPVLLPMGVQLLDAVMAIEVRAYPFPWSRGNFVDSIAAGYLTRCLVSPEGELLGYLVAMAGFREWHLLNVTVSPPTCTHRAAPRSCGSSNSSAKASFSASKRRSRTARHSSARMRRTRGGSVTRCHPGSPRGQRRADVCLDVRSRYGFVISLAEI